MSNLLTVQQVAKLAMQKKPAFNVPWRPSLQQYAKLYSEAVEGCRLADSCMLAAIVARESGGQNIFQWGMPRADGCGVGLCQITAGVDWTTPEKPTFQGYDLFDPAQNLRVAAHYFLEPALERFPDNHVAAFASYNLGGGGVARELAEGLNPDTYTTGNDYGHATFTSWINFSAASMGLNVDWASYKG